MDVWKPYTRRCCELSGVAVWLLLAVVVLLPCHASPRETLPSGEITLRANILYLNSYLDGYAWSDEILNGLRTRLNGYRAVELQVAYMDLKRYPRTHITPLLVDLYKRKFQDKSFDLVVVSDNTIFYFIPFYTQLEGRFYSATEVLEIVHRSTSAPIYTNWAFLLGHSAVGGKMLPRAPGRGVCP